MLELTDVAVTYPNGARALEPASITFARGAITVLLGPSGAGKSTLLRTVNGLVVPSSGRILVEGLGSLAVARALRRHRRATGMIFQQHHLIGRSSALTNVLTGRLGYHSAARTLFPFSGAEKRMALTALERVGMLPLANRRVDQLSGGQQQRVGIARALVQQPSLILADEPVASLDPATAERTLQLFHDICRSDGITAVVSLHQVELACRFADRIVGLAGGRIVFDGPPSSLDAAAISRIYGPSGTKLQGPRSSLYPGDISDEPKVAAE